MMCSIPFSNHTPRCVNLHFPCWLIVIGASEDFKQGQKKA